MYPFLYLLGSAGGLTALAIGYLGLQISSNIAHGPVQGLLPDRVPSQQLGVASSVRILLHTVGLIAAYGLAGRLLDAEGRSATTALTLIGGVLAVSAGITMLGVKEAPTQWRSNTRIRDLLTRFGQLDFRRHSSYWWLIAARFVFLFGICGIHNTAQYYLRDVLSVDNPAKQTGDLLASIVLALVAIAPVGGWLTDRLHPRPIMMAGCLVAAIGLLLLLFARSWVALIVCGSISGAGIGLFLTANWALANRLAPTADAGMFLGLTNLATAGAEALSRLEGPLIDLFNRLRPDVFLGYRAVFVMGAVCSLTTVPIIAFLLRPAPIRRSAGS
jgi:MFS family permease